MSRKKPEITTVNESQLNLLSTEEETALTYHENVIEKGLETFIEVGQSLQYIRDNRLYRQDFNNFANYVKERWGKTRDWANKLVGSVEVTQALTSVETFIQLPQTQGQAQPLAKLKDDPELMAQVWEEAVKEAKLQFEAGLKKSEQPTHKEVEAKVKEYEDKIKELENKQTSLLTELEREKRDTDWQGNVIREFNLKGDPRIKQLEQTVENQNKQIKELNSDISAKENGLKSLETQRADLDLKQQELDERIKKEANVIAQKTLEVERKALMKKEAELTAKQGEIEKQLKEAKSIKNKATKEKDHLTDISDWVLSINDFNEVLKQQKDHVIATLRKIQQVPDLNVLEQSDKEIVNKKIDSVLADFNENTEAYGKALTKVHLCLRKFDNTMHLVAGKTVEVEVMKDE